MYIDHRAHRVAYVTNPAGSQIVRRELACGVEIVPDITDRRAVIAAATQLAGIVGPFTKVLALSEFDLLVVARKVVVPAIDDQDRFRHGTPRQCPAQSVKSDRALGLFHLQLEIRLVAHPHVRAPRAAAYSAFEVMPIVVSYNSWKYSPISAMKLVR
jgi:hypothetical protein